jgi:toxin ParE1/3/4
MKTIEVAPAARDDLHGIALYIADDNPERAVSFVAELEDRFDSIAERPLSFPAHDDISPGIRGAVHGRYLILFRDLPRTVRIVRVLHTARDAIALAAQGGFD